MIKPMIIIKNIGLLIFENLDNSTEEILELLAKIAIRLSNSEGIKYLSLKIAYLWKKVTQKFIDLIFI